MTFGSYPRGAKASIVFIRAATTYDAGSDESTSSAIGPTAAGAALLVAAGGDGGDGYHVAGPSAERFRRLAGSAVNTSYRGCNLWYATPEETAREFSASGAALAISGSGQFGHGVYMEILPGSFKGEVLEGRSTWGAGTATLTAPLMPKAFKDRNLYVAVLGGLRSGGAGIANRPTVTPHSGYFGGDHTLSGFHLFRYMPGTQPTVVWAFGRAANNSLAYYILR